MLVEGLNLNPYFELVLIKQWYESGNVIWTTVSIQYQSGLSAAVTTEHKRVIEEFLSRVANEDTQITIEFQPYMDGDEVMYRPNVIKIRRRVQA